MICGRAAGRMVVFRARRTLDVRSKKDETPIALMNIEPCVIMISGLPGSGKSTTARALSERLGRAAHVEADVLHSMITAGLVMPSGHGRPDPGGEAERQLQMRLQHACLLARSFVEKDFVAIIDDIIIAERFDEAMGYLNGVDVRFVMLAPKFSAVKDRWIAMNSPFAESAGTGSSPTAFRLRVEGYGSTLRPCPLRGLPT